MRSSASPSSRIETTRPIMRRSPCSGEADFLDSIRHSLFPDDVQALLLQGGSKRAEAVWLRLCDLRDDVVYGRLLNEPEQDLGVHEGDVLPLSFRNDEERVSNRARVLGLACMLARASAAFEIFRGRKAGETCQKSGEIHQREALGRRHLLLALCGREQPGNIMPGQWHFGFQAVSSSSRALLLT